TRESLAKLGLKLNDAKTRLTGFQEGFTFLGAFFLGEKTYTPWKTNHKREKVMFIARAMPAGALAKYLHQRAGRPRKAPARRHAAHGWGHTFPAGAKNSMAYLYLTEQGSIVRKSGDRILVERDGAIALDLPYHKLERLLLFGNIQLTSAA